MLTPVQQEQPQNQQEEQLLKSFIGATHTTTNCNETLNKDENENRKQQILRLETIDSETYFDADADANVDIEAVDMEIAMDHLDVLNENYVVDIATMKIADEAMLLSQRNNECDMKSNKLENMNIDLAPSGKSDDGVLNGTITKIKLDEEMLSVGVADLEGSESTEGSDEESDEAYSLARLYDIEIDSNEEEKTISELVEASGQGQLVESNHNNSVRVAFGVILRLMLPLANGVMRGFKGIRDVRLLRVLNTIASSRQALTSLVAFAANTISLNLSSVQAVSHRIEPILKLLKIRKSRDGLESLPDMPSLVGGVGLSPLPTTPTTPNASTLYSPFMREPKGILSPFPTNVAKRKSLTPQPPPPKCCTLNILAEPPPGQAIRADIVFIHGLHGSQANTWKQGLWENERQPVGFERPPKPPVRPPKRPRHSRTALIHPPHKMKRARFAHQDHHRSLQERCVHNTSMDEDGFFDGADGEMANHFSYVCGEPQDIAICDGIEYSFPTFRLRVNDNGRLLQADLESMINSDSNANNNDCNNSHKTHRTKHVKGKNAPKPSPNDPDYSKCWPGDWLPLDCPGVRVIAVNYTTDQYLWRPLWKKKESRSNLIERSREMAELLIKHRVGYGHPIVWVGHSKGGLFVKQIIVDAWESGRPAMAPFWRSARGVFFYSVPHRGSHLASIKAPLLTRSVELIDIEKNSKYLLDLHRRFAGLYHLGHLKIEVFSFVETALTLMSVLYLRIVGVDSADPGIGDVCGIRLDHREICKPRSRDCILYKELVKMINKVC